MSLHCLTIYVAWATTITLLFLNRHLFRLAQALLGKPPKGKAYIRMVDGTSGALVFWDHVRGHCEVHPVFMSEAVAEQEAEKAKAFYSCPVNITIIKNKGYNHGI